MGHMDFSQPKPNMDWDHVGLLDYSLPLKSKLLFLHEILLFSPILFPDTIQRTKITLSPFLHPSPIPSLSESCFFHPHQVTMFLAPHPVTLSDQDGSDHAYSSLRIAALSTFGKNTKRGPFYKLFTKKGPFCNYFRGVSFFIA